ncbi:MAG: hypothetical protein M1834_005822 [Cirrosporium novae-zelandiae]|nr:MAG: hypothetical protein M1834_005822 [Cirrosporium novae-zelandiae]
MVFSLHLLRASRSMRRSYTLALPQQRTFMNSSRRLVIKPFILADIGEGIKEVQIIQWFVEPEARVEQFQKICEVQSDKAAVEITSRFDGVIKKLYYEADDTAQVGKPLCDIDIQSEITPGDEVLTTPQPQSQQTAESTNSQFSQEPAETPSKNKNESPPLLNEKAPKPPSRHASLATPAIRGLLKEHNLRIEDITGTGKDGRVLKEDVHGYLAGRSAATETPSSTKPEVLPDIPIPLTTIQQQMFKTMTQSLSIPHFLYADEVDTTSLSTLRRTLLADPSIPKLTHLPIIIKAASLALSSFPILNSRLDTTTDTSKPHVVYRASHNISFATATSHGLVVPVIKNVSSLTIPEIAVEITRLQSLALSNKLTPPDLSGGTFTVSNIGSIGGTVVAPIIVPNQVGILGLGRARQKVALSEGGRVEAREIMTLSWSADHRIVDGATLAGMAERVRQLLEEPGKMLGLMK